MVEEGTREGERGGRRGEAGGDGRREREGGVSVQFYVHSIAFTEMYTVFTASITLVQNYFKPEIQT